ncbi:lysophospholipid acyltransferase family protein [Rossellomorea aquimaris]|uniref:lysophospholipid acyltransferase family protein n=1 Tax=Rossellomorea aquimaris TaxID=189382 RepID=UPI001CD6CD45|nr:lysophospholipid acyltransferase family protein [Rossellomorea aquimaris]MCA1054983.1 lysophospholipid acyltransferase family protein [Rossellomorea aquimaris]
MIKAKKSPAFRTMFSLYHRRLMKRSFHQIYWRGHDGIGEGAAIFTPNHSSWWDSLILFQLDRHVLTQDLHAMMHEKGMKEYPFFRLIGGFSIDRSHPKEIVRSLNYAKELLLEGKSVCLFPQGDEFHLEKRPLGFQSGVIYLMERCPEIPVIPLSFYYTFGHHQKPEAYLSAGAPVYLRDLDGDSRKSKNAHFEQLCTEQLDQLKELVVAEQVERFTKLL